MIVITSIITLLHNELYRSDLLYLSIYDQRQVHYEWNTTWMLHVLAYEHSSDWLSSPYLV